MGIYICSAEEVEDKFDEFLVGCEGEVQAATIAECWNKMAKKYKWHDNLMAINKFTKKEIKYK